MRVCQFRHSRKQFNLREIYYHSGAGLSSWNFKKIRVFRKFFLMELRVVHFAVEAALGHQLPVGAGFHHVAAAHH